MSLEHCLNDCTSAIRLQLRQMIRKLYKFSATAKECQAMQAELEEETATTKAIQHLQATVRSIGRKWSLALKSASITAQDRGSDFESQHNSCRDYDTVDEDCFPTLEE